MNTFIKRIPPFLVSFIVILAILYLTLYPDPLGGAHPTFPYSDKVMHGLMMAAMVGALAFDFYRFRHAKKKLLTFLIMLVILISVIAFGGLIEIAQGAMKLGRSCDPMDFLADAIGAVVVYLCLLCWKTRRRDKARAEAAAEKARQAGNAQE